MKYCKNCGAEIEMDAKFCTSCGVKIEHCENTLKIPQNDDDSEMIPQNTNEILSLCCPRCGNKDLQVATEMNGMVTGGLYNSGKYGGMSVASNETYWVCLKCGNKFRNPDEIRENIKILKGFSKFFTIFGMVCGFLMFIILTSIDISLGLAVGGCVIGLFLLLCIPFNTKASHSEKVLYGLENGMRKFQK